MTPIPLSSGNRAFWYRELPSTMDAARNHALAGTSGAWIVADRQSAGRGTRGRTWQSPAGNLYATWISDFTLPLHFVTQAHICAGCAVHAALAHLGGGGEAAFRLKWPNDILLGTGKVAGLLIERPAELDGLFLLGIGVNCAAPPSGVGRDVAALADHSIDASPHAVLAAIDAALPGWLSATSLQDDFGRASAYFQRHAAFIGDAITVRDRSGSLIAQGEFCGLDQNGLARIRTADGATRALSAGEIV